jgi:hypothetical protein
MHQVESDLTESAKTAPETRSRGETLRTTLGRTQGLVAAFWVRFIATWVLLYWQGFCLKLFPAFHDLTDKYVHMVWDTPTSWFAAHILRISHPMIRIPSRGSDTEFDWTQDLLFVVLAALIAALWTALRRNSPPGPRARAWVNLALRLVLGTQLALYGITKVIPAQFAPLLPGDFVARFGQSTILSMYWHSVGAASPWYQVSLGLAELVIGTLLVLPKLWILGAALSVLAALQLVLVNVYFDIPVKMHSTHLLAMALILFLPHFERIWNALAANRRVDPLPQRALTSSRSADRAIAVVAVIIFACSTALAGVQAFAIFSIQRGATPPLMGAWRAPARTSPIEYFIVNGYTTPARTSNIDPQHALVAVVLELSDGSRQGWDGMITPAEHRIALIEPPAPANAGSADWPLQFHYEQPNASVLKISGAWAGTEEELAFNKIDLSKLPLSGTSPHWINPAPPYKSSQCRCDGVTGIRAQPQCPADHCPLPLVLEK